MSREVAREPLSPIDPRDSHSVRSRDTYLKAISDNSCSTNFSALKLYSVISPDFGSILGQSLGDFWVDFG